MALPLIITQYFDQQPLEKVFWLLAFVFVAVITAVANIFAPWYYAPIILAILFLTAVLVLKPRVGAYLLAFFVPVTTATTYVAIYGKWNFIIGKKPIDMLPVFLPVVALAFFGLTIMILAKIPKAWIKNPAAVPLVLFLSYAAASISWTDIMQHGLSQFVLLAMNIMLFALVVGTVQDRQSHRRLMWCWVLSMTLQGLIAVSMYFIHTINLSYSITSNITFYMSALGGFFQPSGWPRQPCGLQDFHETAFLINLTIPIALGLLLTETGRGKRLFLLLAVFLIMSVCIRTESRAGVGSLIFMMLGTFLLLKRLRKYFALILVFFPVGVILLALVFNAAFNYYKKTDFDMRLVVLGGKAVESGDVVDPGQGSSNVHGRMNLWIRSFKKYIKVAVQGLGVGNLKYVSQAPHAHSIYFSVLFDFGLIGVTLVLSAFLIMIRKFKVALTEQTSYIQIMSFAFLGGFIAMGFHGLVDFEYNTTSCWFYASMAVATFNIALQEYSAAGSREYVAGEQLKAV